MSLEERLSTLKDQKISRASLTPQQDCEYLDRQFAYIQTLFGPILQLALCQPKSQHEIFELYTHNNSGSFSKAYIAFLNQPHFAGPDPTYDAGIAILLKTYAQEKGISETHASNEFLDNGIFEIYDEKFNEKYIPLVESRLARHLALLKTG